MKARARTTAILRPYWQFEISDLKFPITDRKSSRRLALFLVLMQPDGNEDSAHGDDEDAYPPLAGDSVNEAFEVLQSGAAFLALLVIEQAEVLVEGDRDHGQTSEDVIPPLPRVRIAAAGSAELELRLRHSRRGGGGGSGKRGRCKRRWGRRRRRRDVVVTSKVKLIGLGGRRRR